MRYEKADNMMLLALEMQASRTGITLLDIQEKFNVGRRTAMRMRDSILRIFPQAEEVETNESTKRWRIPSGLLDRMVSFSAEELTALETAVELLERENMSDQAAQLAEISGKVRALMKPEHLRRVEPDFEALLEAEGLAARPGPKPKIRIMVLEALRTAVKGCNEVVLHYRDRHSQEIKERRVHPYGFLNGHRHYLVARHLEEDTDIYKMFSLSGIERVDILADMYELDEDFNIQAYADRSFGLFQEEPTKVVWKFSPEAAENAVDFEFHPTQVITEQTDGSLLVEFTACSDLEMAWHLVMWGDQVEVIEPLSLAEMVKDLKPHWKALP